MTNEIRVDINELQYLTVECDSCHTAVTFDLRHGEIPVPVACPCCTATMEQQARDLRKLRSAFDEIRQHKTPVSFRVARTA
jgi:hypothetical protein